MANDGQHHDSPEPSWVDEFDEVLRIANPNPARVGCPSRDVLIAASRRERPLGDPAYEHLLKCSPCYSEFRALQQTGIPSHADASGRIWWLGAAAAVLLVAAGAVWFVGQRAPEQLVTRNSVATPAELPTELDLRKYAVARSEQRAPELPPVSLPRGRLNLTILLPVGSEPDPRSQILDSICGRRRQRQGRRDSRLS